MRFPLRMAMQFIALALIPVMLVSIWLQIQVLSDARYDRTMRDLGTDASFQVEFERQATSLLIAEVDSFERTGAAGQLQPYIAQFGDVEGLRAEIRRGVSDLVRSPAFPSYWALASQFIHQQVVDFIRGNPSAIAKNGRYGIAIDLQTVAAWIDPFTNDAATDALALTFSDGASQIQLTQSRKIPWLQWLARHALPVAVLSVLGFVITQSAAIKYAADRRRASLMAGIGIAISSLVTLVLVKDQLARQLARIPVERGRPLAREYVDALLSGLTSFAAAFAAAGFISGLVMALWPNIPLTESRRDLELDDGR